MQEIKRLESHLAEIKTLTEAAALLGWDQQTYMPAGGGEEPGGAKERVDRGHP